MSEPLSREQVDQFKPLLDPCNPDAVAFLGGWVGIYSAIALMIDTDAALRAQLAAMTKERDVLKALNETQRLSIKSYQQELEAKS